MMKKTVLCLTSAVFFTSYVFLILTAIEAQENNPNSSSLNLSQKKFGQFKAEELLKRGVEKWNLSRYQEAIDDYTAALTMPGIDDSAKAMALVNRGVAKDNLGRTQEAIDDYNAALKVPGIMDSTKAMALVNRNELKAKLGRR